MAAPVYKGNTIFGDATGAIYTGVKTVSAIHLIGHTGAGTVVLEEGGTGGNTIISHTTADALTYAFTFACPQNIADLYATISSAYVVVFLA